MMHVEKKGERAAFNEAYASLNAAQKEAVDTIDGPVMVIAGPGTGKTQILSLRIGNILLQTDTAPDSILALTFTEAGAMAMRERLHRYIKAQAYQVSIYTFHGFAQRLIRDYPDAYGRVIGARPAGDLDKITIMETILTDTSFKLLRPIGNPAYYVKPLLSILASLKKEYITPDTFAAVVAAQEESLLAVEQFHTKGAHKGKERSEYAKLAKSLTKNRELLLVYRQYKSMLAELRLYDFEDMIMETVTALETHEDMLRDLQEQYQYVLADEHQDVNGSQNLILELLCNFHDNPNIFVVGDEKQAIYRFQGASLENFLHFKNVFKNTKQISLTENYRSGQMILNAAHSLVAVENGPLRELRIPLTAAAVTSSSVQRRVFSHQAIEDATVVAEITELIHQEIAPHEIAVIVRTNHEVEHFASLLRKASIAVAPSADSDILDHPIARALTSFIAAIIESHDEGGLFTLLHGPYWGIDTNDLIKIASARSYGTSLWSILSDPEKLASIGVEHIDDAHAIALTLIEARRRMLTDAPHRTLEFVLQESGFLDFVITQDPLDGVRVVRRLYDEIEKMVLHDKKTTLREVYAVLSLYAQHKIALNAPYIHTDMAAVQVMTAHKSKGLEFTAVFIPHVVDSGWGGAAKRSLFTIPLSSHDKDSLEDIMDDERRLLYVAMTRAKSRLYLSHAEHNTEGKELVASRLFDSIDDAFLEEVSTKENEVAFDPLHDIRTSDKNADIDPMLLCSYLAQRGLSATALNNYLRSPYDYLYRNVLRVPEVQALPLLYGTAVHSVMEWVSAVVAEKAKVPSATEIKHNLEAALARLPITQAEFVRLHEKGFASLLVYIEHTAAVLPTKAKVEFSVRVLMPTGLPELPEIMLTGKLDRLDVDEEGNVTRVVDYKTGKPKSRNEIEGTTKNSNGDYKRQLVFYALLLSLYDDDRYACREGVLSFIEPDAKGKIHEETFFILDEEIVSLKQEIIAMVRDVISGDFISIPCDPAVSSYCHLVQLGNF